MNRNIRRVARIDMQLKSAARSGVNEHDSLDHPRPDIGRSPADLASQPKLGLWPERIVGRRSRRPADPVIDGTNLAGAKPPRNFLCACPL
jgi:hypothetical protein